jgi:hypothetical protein
MVKHLSGTMFRIFYLAPARVFAFAYILRLTSRPTRARTLKELTLGRLREYLAASSHVSEPFFFFLLYTFLASSQLLLALLLW